MVGICMPVCRLVHPQCWEFTSVAGVMHPGAVGLSSGLPVMGRRMVCCRLIARVGESE